MSSAFASGAAGLAMLLAATGANAQVDQISGRWQQVRSNAGACAQCEIAIDPGDTVLNVAANNGWSAAVRLRGSDAASGSGHWSPTGRGAIAGRPFDVSLTAENGRLHMTMVIDLGGGSKRTIKAIYERYLWRGV